MKTINHYARFYALLKKLPNRESPEELKRMFVSQYTNSRTESLREMTDIEYKCMCNGIQAIVNNKTNQGQDDSYLKEIKRLRSAALKSMQKLGIDTTDWDVVDRFCLDKRISGLRFSRLGIPDLQMLIRKIKAIGTKKDASGDMTKPMPPKEIKVYMFNTQIPS